MADTTALKDYLKKLRVTADLQADFSFLDLRLVKKSRIDDLFCCIFATLPDYYKKLLRTKEAKKYNSSLCLNLLSQKIRKKFFLNSSVYVININEIRRLIDTCISSIERDLAIIENFL